MVNPLCKSCGIRSIWQRRGVRLRVLTSSGPCPVGTCSLNQTLTTSQENQQWRGLYQIMHWNILRYGQKEGEVHIIGQLESHGIFLFKMREVHLYYHRLRHHHYHHRKCLLRVYFVSDMYISAVCLSIHNLTITLWER